MRQVREVLREDRRGRAQRDCPPSRRCAVDCPVDVEKAGECRVELAIAGGDDRQRAGDGAVWCRMPSARANCQACIDEAPRSHSVNGRKSGSH